MNREFEQAVVKGSKNTTTFSKVANMLAVEGANGNTYIIREFRFASPHKTIRVINLEGVPTIEIPKPPVKRKKNWEGKFFLYKPRKYGLHPAHQVGPVVKTAVLYAPFHFFYFEESIFEETEGFTIKSYDKYSSKFDRSFTFIDKSSLIEREDPVLKEKATEIFTQIEDLKREKDKLEEKLDELDPLGKLAVEFDEMKQKLLNSIREDEW